MEKTSDKKEYRRAVAVLQKADGKTYDYRARDMGIRCKRPKLELLHGSDYQEGRKRMEDYKRVASALKKRSDVSI